MNISGPFDKSRSCQASLRVTAKLLAFLVITFGFVAPGSVDAQSVSAGNNHSSFIDSGVNPSGLLWTWGSDGSGQIGNALSNTSEVSPFQVKDVETAAGVLDTTPPTNFIHVSAGLGHTVAIGDDKLIYTWGNNSSGQLGYPMTTTQELPRAVADVTGFTNQNFKSVAAGDFHTMALDESGHLWVWGRNNIGQIGDGTLISIDSPVRIGMDVDGDGNEDVFIAIAAGGNHSLALKSDGTLYAWGSNLEGALGLQEEIFTGFPLFAKAPTKVNNDTDWTAIAGGGGHTLALKSDQSLWAWGRNVEGQLGLGPIKTTRFEPVQVQVFKENQTPAVARLFNSIACGFRHSIAVSTENLLYVFGSNASGQLGTGNTTDVRDPLLVSLPSTSVLPITAISGGTKHSLVADSGGNVFATGDNTNGELGLLGISSLQNFAKVNFPAIGGGVLDPDFHINQVTIVGAPTQFSLEQEFSYSFEVENFGGDYTGPKALTVNAYLSTDAVLDPAATGTDILLNSAPITVTTLPTSAAPTLVEGMLTIPAGTSAVPNSADNFQTFIETNPKFYVIFSVDPSNLIVEVVEVNNVSTTSSNFDIFAEPCRRANSSSGEGYADKRVSSPVV